MGKRPHVPELSFPTSAPALHELCTSGGRHAASVSQAEYEPPPGNGHRRGGGALAP